MKKKATPVQISKIVAQLANGKIGFLTAEAIIKGRFLLYGASPTAPIVDFVVSSSMRFAKVLATMDRKGLMPARNMDIDADPDKKFLFDHGGLSLYTLNSEYGLPHCLFFFNGTDGTRTFLTVRICKE